MQTSRRGADAEQCIQAKALDQSQIMQGFMIPDQNGQQPALAETEALRPGDVSPQTSAPQTSERTSRSPDPWPILRLLDIAASLVLLILLAPVFAIIALGIAISDPGPVVFGHRRVGYDGKYFKCYKFRSMYVGAEQKLALILAQDPVLRAEWERDQKLAQDPRITDLGRFLRVTSLDELPQLINVLRGEMSMVGPRPIVAAEVARYGRFIESYYRVKPGLTGLWQINGRSNTSYRRRIAYDVIYARSKCLALDLKILFATIPAVIAGRGSY